MQIYIHLCVFLCVFMYVINQIHIIVLFLLSPAIYLIKSSAKDFRSEVVISTIDQWSTTLHFYFFYDISIKDFRITTSECQHVNSVLLLSLN